MPTGLEQVTTQAPEITSAEAENVSEEVQEEQVETEETVETTEAAPETEDKDAKAAKPPPWLASKEFKAAVQSEADKRAKSYQQAREGDSETIRRLNERISQLSEAAREKKASRLTQLLTGTDADDGVPEDTTKAKEAAIRELVALEGRQEEIESAAEFIGEIRKGIPDAIATKFNLNSPSPNVRARGGMELINEAVASIKARDNFLLAVERVLPEGSEVRKQIEEILEGISDFEGNDKAKELYLADRTRGLRKTVNRKPPQPSGTGGGADRSNMSPRDLMKLGFSKETRK